MKCSDRLVIGLKWVKIGIKWKEDGNISFVDGPIRELIGLIK